MFAKLKTENLCKKNIVKNQQQTCKLLKHTYRYREGCATHEGFNYKSVVGSGRENFGKRKRKRETETIAFARP